VFSFTPRPLYPWGKSPRYPLDMRLGGLESRSGRCGEEKHLAPAGNRTPAVHPVSRRDATDTAVISVLHFTLIFHLISFFNCFIYECLLLPTSPSRNWVVLRDGSSRGNGSPERSPRKTPPHCYLRAAAWQRTQEKGAPTLCWASAIVTHPKRTGP
jgi:hypothetical protein